MTARLLVSLFVIIIASGCNKSFNTISRKIARSYTNRGDRKFDIYQNHPVRKIVKKSLKNYKVSRDTLILVQESDRHTGDRNTIVVLNGKIQLSLRSEDQPYKSKPENYPKSFLDAVIRWDTAYINSIQESAFFHKPVFFTVRIAGGEVSILQPRSYDF